MRSYVSRKVNTSQTIRENIMGMLTSSVDREPLREEKAEEAVAQRYL